VFECVEAEYGKVPVWQFLLELRRNSLDGAGKPYQGAFNRTPTSSREVSADTIRSVTASAAAFRIRDSRR
jgi:hypothetical protein